MKYWILKDNSDNSKYAVVGSDTKPKNVICEAPSGCGPDDGKYITVFDVVENGVTKKAASLNDSQRDIDNQIAHQQALANQYKIDRQQAYPKIGDQLDALYKKLHLNDSTEWDAIATQIESVKQQFPKPE